MTLPTGYNLKQTPTMAPGGRQEQLYDLLSNVVKGGGGGFGMLQQLAAGKTPGFEQMEKPLLSKFQQQILPSIAQRYAGAGVGKSSGFQNTAAGAATNLAESLAGQRQQIQQNALQSLMGLSQQLLGVPTDQVYGEKEQSPFLADLLGGIGGIVGGKFLGNLGGRIGTGIANLFGG